MLSRFKQLYIERKNKQDEGKINQEVKVSQSKIWCIGTFVISGCTQIHLGDNIPATEKCSMSCVQSEQCWTDGSL